MKLVGTARMLRAVEEPPHTGVRSDPAHPVPEAGPALVAHKLHRDAPRRASLMLDWRTRAAIRISPALSTLDKETERALFAALASTEEQPIRDEILRLASRPEFGVLDPRKQCAMMSMIGEKPQLADLRRELSALAASKAFASSSDELALQALGALARFTPDSKCRRAVRLLLESRGYSMLPPPEQLAVLAQLRGPRAGDQSPPSRQAELDRRWETWRADLLSALEHPSWSKEHPIAQAEWLRDYMHARQHPIFFFEATGSRSHRGVVLGHPKDAASLSYGELAVRDTAGNLRSRILCPDPIAKSGWRDPRTNLELAYGYQLALMSRDEHRKLVEWIERRCVINSDGTNDRRMGDNRLAYVNPLRFHRAALDAASCIAARQAKLEIEQGHMRGGKPWSPQRR